MGLSLPRPSCRQLPTGAEGGGREKKYDRKIIPGELEKVLKTGIERFLNVEELTAGQSDFKKVPNLKAKSPQY